MVFLRKVRRFPQRNLYRTAHQIHSGGNPHEIRADAVAPHPPANLDQLDFAALQFHLGVRNPVLQLQGIQRVKHHLLDTADLALRQQRRLQMCRLNKVGGACGIFLGDRKEVMLPFPGHTLHTVFLSAHKLFHHHFFLKACSPRLFKRPPQFSGLLYQRNAAAARPVGGLYDQRIRKLKQFQFFRALHKAAFGRWVSGAPKGGPHRALICGKVGCLQRIAHQPHLLRHIIHGKHRKIRGDRADPLHTNAPALLQNLLFFHNADRIKKVGALFAHIPHLPRKNMGFAAHCFRRLNQRFLQIRCSYDRNLSPHSFCLPLFYPNRLYTNIPPIISARAATFFTPSFSLKITTPKKVTYT